MIETTYTVSRAEWTEAQALWTAARAKKLPGYTAAQIFSGILAFFIAMSVFRLPPWMGGGLLISWICVLAFASWRKKAIRNYLYEQATDQKEPTELRIDESGYFSTRPGFNECRMTWRCFTGWREGATVFVLGRGVQFCIVPKQSLMAGQIAELKFILTSNVN